MSIFKYRGRLTIIAEILKTTKESERGKKKTNIMHSVKLTYPQANEYLNLLLTNGLLSLDSQRRYKITKKGLELMETLESINLKLE